MWMIQMPSGWHHGGLFMGLHWLWWIFWILVVLVIGWAFWRLVRDERTRDREETRREDAEEVLRRRFSAGEIDEDEFLHRMHLLRESRPPAGGRSSES
jgi:putative membrane protein